MSQELHGTVTGLSPSERKALENLYRRRVPPSDIVSPELAATLAELSAALHRQIGLLIDRRGAVAYVVVGDAFKLMLPDIGRQRGAQGRLRGLRLVHTHLRGESLTRDDLTDLALLRLDLVAAITIERGRPHRLFIGHLDPDAPPARQWAELPAESPHAPTTNFIELIAAIEARLERGKQARELVGEKNRALLVHVAIGNQVDSVARIAELRELCRTAGVTPVEILSQRRPAPDPKYLIGQGKLEQVVLHSMQLEAEMIVFDCDLTPAQAKAISDATSLKVIDRTMLILDIFAKHAASRDGKLQVELAQLKYTLPRLADKNTMMSRLVGGIGGRGPGETKLEISRRRARDKINVLEHKLRDLGDDRRLRRQKRERAGVPIVAICGYTNAGKSTLLNALTAGDARAENKLFATLDPISRRLRFPKEREIVLTDTVGFIRDLPKDLVAAFRATLEEMADADLLIQVVDASDADREQQIDAVDRILADLGLHEKPRLLVWNKCDRLPATEAEFIADQRGSFAISALHQDTLGPLLLAMERALWATQEPAVASRVGALAL